MRMYWTLIWLWILVGWCGSGAPTIVIKGPLHGKDPEPPPRPEWLVSRIIGVVTGVIGGWAFSIAFGPYPEPWLKDQPRPEPWIAVFAAATAVGAFVVSRFVTDIYGRIRQRT